MYPKHRKRDVLQRILEAPGRTLINLLRPQSSAPSTPSATLAVGDPTTQHGQSIPVGLRKPLNTSKKSVGTAGGLGSVVGALIDCFGNMPTAAHNHQDYEELASNVATTLQGFDTRIKQMKNIQMSKAMQDVVGELQKQAEYITRKQSCSNTKRYLDAQADIDDLMKCYRRVGGLLQQLQSNTIINIWKNTDATLGAANDNFMEIHLTKLAPVRRARYDSNAASQVRRSGCTPGTRQLMLQELQDWASDPNGARLYWLNGMAGTGKTTIAYSLCSRLETSNHLVASFFCSRLLPDCQDVMRIIPTIAYQLARLCRPFQDALCLTLASDYDFSNSGIASQFESLLLKPIELVKSRMSNQLLMVVVDAMDECMDRANARLFLNELLGFSNGLPIRFFVTCRPDHAFLEKVTNNNNPGLELYHLHNIEQSLLQADIEAHLAVELKMVCINDEHIHQLARRAGRLFIYAAAIVRYLTSIKASVDHQRRLEIILGAEPAADNTIHRPIAALYAPILASVAERCSLDRREKESIRRVLHAVVCSEEPLTVSSLACMLNLNPAQVWRALEPLQSVINVDRESSLVATLHPSFSDYVLSTTRSSWFFCDDLQPNRAVIG